MVLVNPVGCDCIKYLIQLRSKLSVVTHPNGYVNIEIFVSIPHMEGVRTREEKKFGMFF